MTECWRFRESIERLLSDEIVQDELEQLLAHTQECANCEKLFELHHDLSDPQLRLTEPEAADLMGVRRAVLRQIRTREAASRATIVLTRLRLAWLRPAVASVLAASLIVVALAAGVLIGRGTGLSEPVTGRGTLVPEIQRAASAVHSLQDTAESPYVYSNVRLRETADGRVALSFDVATHLELVRPEDDPLVTEVLLQSMLQDDSLATRLNAITHTADRTDPRVTDALILVMLDDPSLPVRLKALSKLASAPVNRQVEQAMLQVLEHEESVQMRLQAIDYLAREGSRSEELFRAIDSVPPSQRFALRARARRYQ
jgi:hypothetical protein